MTEKQKKVYDYLASMYLDPNLEVKFSTNDEYSVASTQARVKRDGKIVKLLLPEVYDDNDLKSWEDALVEVDKMLQAIKREEEHECSNPNFTKAVKAKLSLMKKYK